MGIIYVTGAQGMLGQAVARVLTRQHPICYSVVLLRRQFDITDCEHIEQLEKDSTVINCAGITKGRTDVTDSQMVKVNSYGPILLAERVRRLVQVSTDCVFSGSRHCRPYSETDPRAPSDFYGKTKLAGEPLWMAKDQHLIVRSSFIGFGPHGLLAWLLAHEEGATVDGYTSWTWSGLYVGAFARLLVDIALDETITGPLHIPGPTLTKYDLLHRIAERIRPDLNVVPKEPALRDMALRSIRDDVWDRYTIPTWDEMLEELDGDYRSGAGRAV